MEIRDEDYPSDKERDADDEEQTCLSPRRGILRFQVNGDQQIA